MRIKTGFNHWKNTDSVIEWYKDILQKNPDRSQLVFISFDIVSFYPSITEQLLVESLNWASTIVKIPADDREVIMKSAKSLLYLEESAFCKKGRDFDVSMGAYDGAEKSDLVGLYSLSKLQDLGLNIGLYRDDGLAVSRNSSRSGRPTELRKKKLVEKFKQLGLSLTTEANVKIVNFLDITLDLNNGDYRPFMKENGEPQYINKLSNHPPTVIKNIPLNVNNRLSRISADEDIFEAAAPPYQAALENSGYDFVLKYDENVSNKPQKRKRNRKVVWFNPPYSQNIKTNIGREFLKIVKETFHKNHPLYKICNRNTLKVSYRAMPNMKAELSKHNNNVLRAKETPDPEPSCNCQNKTTCPLPGRCTISGVIYTAEVTRQDTGKVEFYTGLTDRTFKKRWYSHKASFENPDLRTETRLATYIWKLKDDGIPYTLKWNIIDRGKAFNPVTNTCRLCLLEKFHILYHPETATLNHRSELFSKCLHKQKYFLT